MFGLHDRLGRFRALLAALLHQDNQNTPMAKQLYQAFRAQTLADISVPASPFQRAAPAAKQAEVERQWLELAACKPATEAVPFHVFALAHLLKRPIVVQGQGIVLR
jgi:hypothetical protein